MRILRSCAVCPIRHSDTVTGVPPRWYNWDDSSCTLKPAPVANWFDYSATLVVGRADRLQCRHPALLLVTARQQRGAWRPLAPGNNIVGEVLLVLPVLGCRH